MKNYTLKKADRTYDISPLAYNKFGQSTIHAGHILGSAYGILTGVWHIKRWKEPSSPNPLNHTTMDIKLLLIQLVVKYGGHAEDVGVLTQWYFDSNATFFARIQDAIEINYFQDSSIIHRAVLTLSDHVMKTQDAA